MPGAAVVLARAPVPGACKNRLEPLLGPDGCARLQATLIARAVAWAHAAAPGAAYLGHTGAAGGVRGLVAAATHLFEQVDGDLGRRLVAAAARVHARTGGPLLVVGADVPALGPAHAAAALDDLHHGCDVVLGPSTDGGYYLIGLREPRPELFALGADAWGGRNVLRLTVAAAERAGLSVGLLRAERDLHEPADARALLADPLTPADVRDELVR